MTAHVWETPAVRLMTPEVSDGTSTGVELFTIVPLPSCPKELLPQHFTPPALVNAQVWAPPKAKARTPLVSPVTSAGDELAGALVPLPSCPALFCPQHFTPPATVSAQVWP